MYPHLPSLTPDTPQPGETLITFGLRVLAFVLREEVTATLSDFALETADHAYPYAISNREFVATLPSMGQVSYQNAASVALDRLSHARRLIQASLRGRKEDAAREAQDTAQALPSEYPEGGPGTHKVPLIPVPKVNPPTQGYAEIQPREHAAQNWSF